MIQACVRYATLESGVAKIVAEGEYGIRDIDIFVLGEFGNACFVVIQQVPLVLFGYLAPGFNFPRGAWARRARSRRGGGSSSLE